MLRNHKVIVCGTMSLSLASAAWAQCDQWLHFESTSPNPIHAFTNWSNQLIGGGAAVDGAGLVAQWNGSSWTTLADADGVILALSVYNGELVVGGTFDTIGGIAASRVARFDGSTWKTLGSGLEGPDASALAFLVHSGNLFVGGSFTTAGGTSANSIARWDGSAWHALDSGVTQGGVHGTVAALTVDSGWVVAGGSFDAAGGLPVSNIARWGGVWSWPQSGVTGGSVRALISHGGLIAAGNFEAAGGVPVNRIARFSSGTWTALGSGVSGGEGPASIAALALYNGELIVGGSFTDAGGTPAANVARYSHLSGWSALGDGLPSGTESGPAVRALRTHGEHVFAGGSMIDHVHVARWRGCAFASCMVECGIQTPSGCYCDTECFFLGDCCDDVCQHCTFNWCTCEGHCGGTAPGAGGITCSCDDACADFNDCCADLCPWCGRHAACGCAGDVSSSGGSPDGAVDIFDLLFALANWGPCPAAPEPCLADVGSAGGSPDGMVDIFDLLFILANWGPCP